MRRGRCLCGAVSYEADGEPLVVAHCHCLDCQRQSGSGHTTGAMFASDNVRIDGVVAEFFIDSGSESVVTRSFCGTCGSSLFGRNTKMPGFVTIAVGTLDDPGAVNPQVAVFARSRRPWDCMDPTLPTFETQPAWKPSDGV